MLNRLRIELRDFLELVLIPAMAVVLPWRICFRLFRLLASFSFLYRSQTQAALQQARQRGWVEDEKSWLLIRRLTTLVDHADYYLALSRSDAWLKAHLDVHGCWPEPGSASLLCSFHWGAGMWSLRHAAASGLRIHALAAPLQGAHFEGRWILHRYAKARTAMVRKILGRETLDPTASLRPLFKAIHKGEQVLAVVDVPADQVSASQSVKMLGRVACVPRGIFRLAVEHKIPLTLYLTGFDVENGRRFLRLRQFGTYSEVSELIADVFVVLDHAIVENPPAWHFWSEADRFFITEE